MILANLLNSLNIKLPIEIRDYDTNRVLSQNILKENTNIKVITERIVWVKGENNVDY